MISVEKCRELIGLDDKKLSDEEIIKIRSSLYELAELSLECYFEKSKKRKIKPNLSNN